MDLIAFALIVKSIHENHNGCKIWPMGRDDDGYGRVTIEGKTCGAHRESHKFFNGELEPGFFACHKCDCPPCVNPEHIFAGTHAENMLDMARKGRAAGRKRKKVEIPFHKPIIADESGKATSLERTIYGPLIITWSNLGGWMATCGGRNILNPYTKTLFTNRKSCARIARFFIKHGFYPQLKPTIIKDRKWISPSFYEW